MKVESLIYIYGAICLSMIGFNIVYSLILRRREPHIKKKCEKFLEKINEQIGFIRSGGTVDDEHLTFIEQKMKRVNNLIAFDRVLEQLRNDASDDAFSKYLMQIRPAIMYLAVINYKRESMQTAYFSFFLTRYITNRHMDIDSIQDILLDYIKKDSLYCSVNALQALYTFGNTEHIISALKLQDLNKTFLHQKILTEGLLSFTGDHGELIRLLWQEFESFSEHMQLAIMNYIRFKADGYQKEMFDIMQDISRGKELRLAAIRYFGKYYYEPALEPLLAFASDRDEANWEYANVSIASLMKYKGFKVMEALKQALHSSNWYIRQSAAVCLEAHGVDYSSMMDVIAGNDRFAREMITYRLESQRLQKSGDKQ